MATTITLQVRGMDCEKCEARISGAVSRLDGVQRVTADHRTGQVRVLTDAGLDRAAVVRQVTEAGYDVADGGDDGGDDGGAATAADQR